jgi:anti-sigma factor RsiW
VYTREGPKKRRRIITQSFSGMALAVGDLVEVRVAGKWEDGVVSAVQENSNYSVDAGGGGAMKLTDKAFPGEVRARGPRHTGEIWTADEYWRFTWLEFLEQHGDDLDGSDDDDSDDDDVDEPIFGEHRWSCCRGKWNSPPCG